MQYPATNIPTDSQCLSKVYVEANNSFWPSRWIPTMISDYTVLLKLASLPVDMLVLATSPVHLHLIGPSLLWYIWKPSPACMYMF